MSCLFNNYIGQTQQNADTILQLKYNNSNMFRPSSGHLQEKHINYMHITNILCK